MGLTLTEVLVVVLILGVLSGVSVLTLGNSRVSAVQNSCKSAFSALELAISSYQADSPTANMSLITSPIQLAGYINQNLISSNDFSFALAFSVDSHTVTVKNKAGSNLGTAPAACSQL